MELNKIYNENCLDTMARMPENFIDLTVTSPPYDNLRTYNGYEFDWKKVIEGLYRVTKDGGVVVWVVGDATIKGSETGTSFRQALFAMDCGFRLHDTMIYEKLCYMPKTHNRQEQAFEYMFVWSKGKPKTVNHKMKTNIESGKVLSGGFRHNGKDLQPVHGAGNKVAEKGIDINIWRYNVGWNHSYSEEYLKGHPAIFPYKLAEDHIKVWSNEGDTVYDCFMGSGTTAKMAILNNRNYIGSEISEEYCEIAEKRILGTRDLFNL